MFNSTIKKRVFIVGSPRSGSTLLQNLLLNYSQFCSFPETHFFYTLCNTNRLYQLLKTTNQNNIKAKFEELGKLLNKDVSSILKANNSSYKFWINAYVALLDKIAQDVNKEAWIEKTPMHLHYTKVMSKYIQNIRFIHIIRSGADVATSVYNYSSKYPEKWEGERMLENCIERWETDVKLSKACLGKKGHLFIKYEDLINNEPSKLKKLSEELGVEYIPENFLQVNQQAFKQTVQVDEPWKNNVSQKIVNTNGGLFQSVLTPTQQQFLLQRVAQTDLSCF